MTTQASLLQKAMKIGQYAKTPVIDFSNITIKVADRSFKEHFKNTKDFATIGFQHMKSVPGIRSLGDAKSFVDQAKTNTITYAKQSLAIAKEGSKAYKHWFDESVKGFKAVASEKPKRKSASKKTSAKSQTTKETGEQ